MDVEDLRAFVEIANSGGITPPARTLGLSKSVVSRRLVRLEEIWGLQLVAGMSPTRAYNALGKIQAVIELLIARFGDLDGDASDTSPAARDHA